MGETRDYSMREKVKKFIELVKFEHTVFALPFAYLGMMLAKKSWPGFGVFFWVTAAMVGARTAGMTLNRMIDVKIDQKNPRTQNRALVTRELNFTFAWALVGLSLAVFFVSAYQLGPLCFKLSPVALFFLIGYHYVKRFSFFCHWTLGVVLAIAPLGGWIAASGGFSYQPIFVSLAVLFWVAGFDILYSLQDADFDRANHLHSAPVKFGVPVSLKISEYCHWATILFFVIFGAVMSLGALYWVGLVIVAGLLKFEHRLVGEGDLSRINTAFFTVNGWIGILPLVFTFLDRV